jgi:twitching motility protein PilJ
MNIAAGSTGKGLSATFWVVILVIAIAGFAGNTGYAAYLAGQENEARGHASNIQVKGLQLATFARNAVDGNQEAFGQFRDAVADIQASFDALGANYTDAQVVGAPLAQALATWTPMAESAARISAAEEQVLGFAGIANTFKGRVPQLQARLDEMARAISTSSTTTDQVFLAVRQVVLADRMTRRVTEIQAGGAAASSARDALSRDAQLFGQVLTGLREGSAELGANRITSPAALAALEQADLMYADARVDIEALLEASTELYEVQNAAEQIVTSSETLLADGERLAESFNDLPASRAFPNTWYSIGFGIATLLAIVALLATLYSDQRKRFQLTQELNQRNQEAILRLLDEMGSLAEGDLTVKATVTEDITGAIADSINFAVDALRSLVTTINETAVQVAAAAQETQATAIHLAEAAEHQAQQINSASAKITEIASNIDQVSKNSAESADVANRSVQIAAKGAEVVRQTIQGMDNIRDQIQETSKRIKRLGESSQEIGSIIELINDISEQTNILALNAAIQAASAGEAGRGFAVVADEVQRLAERASNATKRIETLVGTIQSDTNEAVSSMEQTTAEVVAGARLAEDAGLALGEIEKVSGDLAGLIQGISDSARQQSAAATNITSTMNVIQEITTQTSQGASQTAESIGNLAQLAADLRRSVADFKLPG